MTQNEVMQALKNGDKKTALKFFEPAIAYSFKALTAGVLKKNVVLDLVHRGLPEKSAKNLVDVATVRAENFGHKNIK